MESERVYSTVKRYLLAPTTAIIMVDNPEVCSYSAYRGKRSHVKESNHDLILFGILRNNGLGIMRQISDSDWEGLKKVRNHLLNLKTLTSVSAQDSDLLIPAIEESLILMDKALGIKGSGIKDIESLPTESRDTRTRLGKLDGIMD